MICVVNIGYLKRPFSLLAKMGVLLEIALFFSKKMRNTEGVFFLLVIDYQLVRYNAAAF
jgi:hypothetical protein